MAELNQVFGLPEDFSQEQNGMNGGGMNGGGMNGGGAMNGGGGGMNGGGAMNGMGGSIQQEEGLNDEVDKTINKLKQNIQKQKTINSLKNEWKKTGDEPSSMVDRYVKSKKDVYKLFVMALLVLLALSMNDIVKYYLSKYIMNNDLTNNNELYLRISIPLSVLFLIWTMKALTK